MNRIKEILDQQGRTQAWLARSINKSYSIVNHYCHNRTQPDDSILYLIAFLLDTDYDDLFVRSENIKERVN